MSATKARVSALCGLVAYKGLSALQVLAQRRDVTQAA